VSCGVAARGFMAAAGAVLVAAGCGRSDDRLGPHAPTNAAADLVRDAGAAVYTPPSDDRLTAAQVRLFLAVRERECRLRETAASEPQRSAVAAPAATVVPVAPAELRAARDLHANPKEYAWVRQRVMEAELAASTQALNLKMAAGREQLLARKRRELAALTDAEQRATVQHEIEDWQRGLQGSEPVLTPAVRSNIALLARFREPLARLRTIEERSLAANAGLDSLPATTTAAAAPAASAAGGSGAPGH
jgi:hypothetical protein